MIGLTAGFLVGVWADPRVILGLNPWIKPIKFALSIAIYVWTIAWLLGDVRDRAPRSARVIGVGTAVALWTEMASISLQSWRGVPSHFNQGTPFDGAVFGVMGLMILLNTLLACWLLLLYVALPTKLAPPRVWAVRLGLALFLVGSAVGGQMVSRNAHAVGVADGGPGLPFVNWSTRGGDLRIAHALGLHALQALPLLAWGLERTRWPRESRRTPAVFAAAVAWALLFGLALAQALAGRPLA